VLCKGLNESCAEIVRGESLVSWYRHYTLIIAVHVLEVVIVGLAVVIVNSVRPTYNVTDVIAIIAVGMIAGAIYVLSVGWLERKGMSESS
jgi:hypothetical protein